MTRRAPGSSACGMARLEFAITLVLVGWLVALTLQRIVELQGFARLAEARTAAAQLRANRALDEARRTFPARAAASAPRPYPTAQAPLPGAAP